MTFSRIKGAGWSTSEELTSAQITALDLDHSKAVDKTGDSITGTVHVAASALLNIQATGSLNVASAATLSCASGSFFTVTSGCTATIAINGSSAINASATGAVIQANAAGAYIQATGSGRIRSTNSGRIVLDDNDWPLLGISAHTGRSRTTVIALGGALRMPYTAATLTSLGAAPTPVLASMALVTIGAGFKTTVASAGSSTARYAYLMDITPWCHNGATLSSATLYFTTATHGGLIDHAPAFGFFRAAAAGADFAAATIASGNRLHSTGYTEFTAPVSLPAYSAQALSLVHTPDQNNVIDKTAYSYHLVVWDEGGTSGFHVAGNTYHSVVITQSSITDMRFQ